MTDDVAAIIEVTLVGARPAVRRLISIPYSLSLNRFHSILQLVMGWNGQAAHVFVGADLIAADPNEVSSADSDPEDETQLFVQDLLPFISAEALYYCDLAHKWRHRLRLLDFDFEARADEVTLLKASGWPPGNIGASRPVRKQKASARPEKNRSKTGASTADLMAINEDLSRLANGWKRKRRGSAKKPKHSAVADKEMIPLDTNVIRAGYLNDLETVRNSILAVEDALARHDAHDVPEFRRCVNLEFGTRLSGLRELQQEIDWLTARLALVQKLMQHGFLPVSRAYLQAILIETGQTPYPNFPPERDETEIPQPEQTINRETVRDFISASSDEFLSEEEVDSLTEDVLKEAGKRDLVAECKSLYRKIVSLLHPDRAGEMTPERKELWLRAQDAYADGDLLSLRSILDRCDVGTRDRYLTCSEIIDAIAEASVQLQAIEMFRERVAKEPSWDFCRLNEKKRKSRLRRVTKDLDEEESSLNIQLAELQRACQSLEEEAKDWEDQEGGGSVQLDLFR